MLEAWRTAIAKMKTYPLAFVANYIPISSSIRSTKVTATIEIGARGGKLDLGEPLPNTRNSSLIIRLMLSSLCGSLDHFDHRQLLDSAEAERAVSFALIL